MTAVGSTKVLKRPSVGDAVETGRYGWCLVGRVHGTGMVLTVTDRIGRTEQVKRAGHGWWRVARTPALSRLGQITNPDGTPWWHAPALSTEVPALATENTPV